ncbi:glycosyltransferase [Candidatus Dojkabacteria bacterium]|nr:glycosyltransferase [Candidatus Dojkabacteria bacterium]
MRIALLVPHIFMWKEIKTIFAPGSLAIDLAEGLRKLGHSVSLFTPGPVITKVKNINADLIFFKEEAERLTGKKISTGAVGKLIKSMPLTFLSLSRQIQSDLISKCYKMANMEKFDIVHVYTNEEEIAMAFSNFVKIPIVFTHHEPFNFLARYRTAFQKYRNLNFISISKSQQKDYPYLKFVGNIYHGIDVERFRFNPKPKDYYVFFGRIIKPKGTHLAIQACLKTGQKLKIAGQHYTGHGGDKYWQEKIEPFIDGKQIQYVGYLKTDREKSDFLGNAKALLMPVQWEEPFGMVMLEAMSCGTPVIGYNMGSLPEIVSADSGIIVESENKFIHALKKIESLDRKKIRDHIKNNFNINRMIKKHVDIYNKIIKP